MGRYLIKSELIECLSLSKRYRKIIVQYTNEHLKISEPTEIEYDYQHFEGPLEYIISLHTHIPVL